MRCVVPTVAALALAAAAPPASAATTGANVLVVTGVGTGAFGRNFNLSGTATVVGTYGLPVASYPCAITGSGNGTQGSLGGACGPISLAGCGFVAAEIGLVVTCTAGIDRAAAGTVVVTVPHDVLPTTSYEFAAVLAGAG